MSYLKEFVVCYTLENDIIRELIITEPEMSKEEVIQERIEKIEQRKYFLAKGDHGDYCINPSLIRYIQVHENDGRNIDLNMFELCST
ncbi:hypothetical protein SAMN05444673_3252 [Bacillus sp. OV166]|uniref:hypothetical protein n=1 Tax=Bacillus sp. OV166 TaxID=1882763 RepID=UPI000A2AB9E0|nr:hypothetical protein [Bacillus sp. OV166]SMQ78122.1 hypothetical protein SAMN05444673_3252 [Bacillus sp. OV166]